jgi:hypothetical protein
MGQLDKLEAKLDDVLNKKAPFKIPADGRKSLAGSLWVIALIFGLLQLWLAWNFWNVGHAVDRLVDYANTLSAAYGGSVVGSHLGPLYYVTLLVLVADAAILLLAAPGLKAMRKSGWNLAFYSMLLNAVYGVVVLFSDYGGFGDLLGALVGSVIGAYLLFQVRDLFKGEAVHPAAHKPEASPKA